VTHKSHVSDAIGGNVNINNQFHDEVKNMKVQDMKGASVQSASSVTADSQVSGE